jgi:GNAT superfamily N-acetyltransferase
VTEYPLSDVNLSRRLERCEGAANAAFCESHARIDPASGATWTEVGGAYAMFDGAGSPLTQTFGLGIFQLPTEDDFAKIESFFAERGAEVFHEVSPIAGPQMIELLVARDYRPVEMTSVMFRPIGDVTPRDGRVRARTASPEEVNAWADVAAEGWGETPELSAFIRQFSQVVASAERCSPFFAEMDGRPIATGAIVVHGGVGLLAGASTIPSARNQGAQRALLETRLAYAKEQGCDLAMMCAAPGSASQRNAERQGFRIAYTRTKWHRSAG